MQQFELTLDYETRSECDLKTAGAIEYAKHPSTSILCVGYQINDEKPKLWIPERAPMPKALSDAFEHGRLIAHNAGFEAAITRHCLTRYSLITRRERSILLNLKPNRWKCTAAKAAASSLPRGLEAACVALGLPIQKDMEGHRLMKKHSKPRKPSKNNPAKWFDDPKERRRIYRYCLIDVKAERLLDKAIPDLTPYEQEVWELDRIINERGILIDTKTVQLILDMIAEEKREIKKAVFELSNGHVESATQRDALLNWVNRRLKISAHAPMPDLRAPTVKDILELKDLPKEVRTMLEYRQAASQTSTAKYRSMMKTIGDDGRARDLLLYWGAQPTGRWAGKRLQPQNFPRPKIAVLGSNFSSDEAIKIIQTQGLEGIRKKYGKTHVMEVLASCVRGMLIPSPGKEFFVADFSAVEARLAFWFADEEEGLSAYREGRKIYEEMAADTFDIKLSWLLTEEGKASLERFVGKESVLGCQYGMGAPKFKTQCHNKGMKSVTNDIAGRAVKAYRAKYKKVCEAWGNLEYAAIAAVKNPNTLYETNHVKIWKKGRFLFIELPSGRRLKYFKPSVRVKEKWGRQISEFRYWTRGWVINPETGKPKKEWCEVSIWGGIFFNHVVQGTARDLMVCGVKNIENAGYEFLLSVHDEGISERNIGEGSLEEYLHLMAGKFPSWAPKDLIKAEGWKGMRYRK